jgi:hypothetical protein
MTIYEMLFGTPERAARTLGCVDQIDACDFMENASGCWHPPEKCVGCLYDYDRYGCEHKGLSLIEWLATEVSE